MRWSHTPQFLYATRSRTSFLFFSILSDKIALILFIIKIFLLSLTDVITVIILTNSFISPSIISSSSSPLSDSISHMLITFTDDNGVSLKTISYNPTDHPKETFILTSTNKIKGQNRGTMERCYLPHPPPNHQRKMEDRSPPSSHKHQFITGSISATITSSPQSDIPSDLQSTNPQSPLKLASSYWHNSHTIWRIYDGNMLPAPLLGEPNMTPRYRNSSKLGVVCTAPARREFYNLELIHECSGLLSPLCQSQTLHCFF